MAKTIRARFSGGQIELLEKSDIPEGTELKITFEEKPKAEDGPEKGKWAKVAEEMSRDGLLTGKSEEFLKLSKQFRENFVFRNPLTIKND